MTPELQSKLTRAGMTLLGVAAVALNKKFGLQLDMSDIISLSSIIVAFVGSSNWKEAAVAGHEAAVKIASVQDAAAVIGKPADPAVVPP